MRRLAALLLLAGLAACGDEGPPPGPGVLEASIVGPNGDEGAAVVLLLGDGIASVGAAGGSEVFVREGDSMTRVVVVHPTGGALGFVVSMDDVTDPPAWVVEEVAGPDDQLRSDVASYSVEFVR